MSATKSEPDIFSNFVFRYQRDDKNFIETLQNLEKFFQSRFLSSPLNYMPVLRHFGFLHKVVSREQLHQSKYLKPMKKIHRRML